MGKKIKILRIIARLNIGGPAQHVVFLNEGLERKNYETLLIAGFPDISEGNMDFILSKRNIKITFIKQLVRKVSPLLDLIALFRLIMVLFKLNKFELHDSMLHVFNYRSVVSMHVLIQSHEMPYFECHLA